MRPIDLDESSWRGLYERAVSQMAQLLPGWNDNALSDPSVALLELFSFLSDAQNYELNSMKDEDYLAYLKLLGGQKRKRTPARLLAEPNKREGLFPGRRFQIEGVPFEVMDTRQPADRGIAEVIVQPDGARQSLAEGAPLAIRNDTTLDIRFTSPLSVGVEVRLWCQVLPEPGRVPPDEETEAPVRLCAAIPGEGGWQETRIQDGTCGFLQNGFLTFTPPAETDQLRLTIRGQVEGEPRLTAVVLEPVFLEQRCTRSRWAELRAPFRLPEGWAGAYVLRFFAPYENGWREVPALYVEEGLAAGWTGEAPAVLRVTAADSDFTALHALRGIAQEEVPLEEPGVLKESLSLMVEEDGLWYDCPVCEPSRADTLSRGCRWDDTRSVLRFGDGRDFDVPRSGRLLVLGCACTLGARANGAGGLLAEGDLKLRSLHNAQGGSDAEDAISAFHRVLAEQEELCRAVTCADYEVLARRTPGLRLDHVRALPSRALGRAHSGITLLAKPRSGEPLPDLSPWQRERLHHWLEPFRLVGVPLRIEGPRYVPLEIRLAITTMAPVTEESLRAVAVELTDGVAGPLDFGAEVSYSALFSALGAVPNVRAVRALEVRPLSAGARRTQDGGLSMDPDVLSYLKRFIVAQE